MKTKSIPFFAGLLFSVIIGFSFLGIKVCTPYANTLLILVHRYNVAMLAVIIAVLLRIGSLKNIKGKPKGRLFAVSGFYVAFMVFQTISMFYSTSVEGAILFAFVPVVVMIISRIFLKEKTTVLTNVFICVCIASLIIMIVLGTRHISFSPTGTIFMLIAIACMAIENVLLRYNREIFTPFEITSSIVALGFITFNLAFFIIGFLKGYINTYFNPLMHLDFDIAIIFLGVGCILLSSQLIAYLNSHMPATNASLFNNLSTAISVVAGVLILNEPLHLYHIICSILIVSGVIVINFSAGKSKSDNFEVTNQD